MNALGTCDVVLAFSFWLLMAINMIRLHFGVKPGQNFHFALKGMIVFFPSQLTEDGLSARRYIFVGLFGFLACIGVALLLNCINGGPQLK